MDLIGFFDSDELELPKTYNAGDFEGYIDSCFTAYLASLRGLQGGDPVVANLKTSIGVAEDLCQVIRQSISRYLDGYPSEAFNTLANGVAAIEHPWLDALGSLPDVSEALQHMYRVRTGAGVLQGRRELFHIPYHLRHLVTTQRYSIPGFPSLYLGGSLWVCWEELGRPPFDSMNVARFRPAPDVPVKILDFGWRPARMAALIDHDASVLARPDYAKFIGSQAICWPLLAACSVRVRNPGAAFVPEYIVPQLLLQWVRLTKDFDGIRYFSTRMDQYVNDPHAEANFVFPATKSQVEGHCSELRHKFLLSEPAAWSILRSTDFPGGGRRPPTWKIELVKGSPIGYLHTHFWECENKVDAFPCDRVSAGQRVHQVGRFGDAQRTSLSRRRHTSAPARVSAARCDQVKASFSEHRATLRAVDRIVSRG